MKRNILPGILVIAILASSVFAAGCKDKKQIGPTYTDWTAPSSASQPSEEASSSTTVKESETPTPTPSPEPTATPTPSPSPTPVPEYVEPTLEGGPKWYSGYVDPRTVRAEIVSNPKDIAVLVNKYYQPGDLCPGTGLCEILRRPAAPSRSCRSMGGDA